MMAIPVYLSTEQLLEYISFEKKRKLSDVNENIEMEAKEKASHHIKDSNMNNYKVSIATNRQLGQEETVLLVADIVKVVVTPINCESCVENKKILREMMARIDSQDLVITELRNANNQQDIINTELRNDNNKQNLIIGKQSVIIESLLFGNQVATVRSGLQDANTLYQIEKVLKSKIDVTPVTAMRGERVENAHFTLVSPLADKPLSLGSYESNHKSYDSKAVLCMKLAILRKFLSSPLLTDDIIDEVGRDAFDIVKKHLEDKTAGDVLAHAKTLTPDQQQSVFKAARRFFCSFSEFKIEEVLSDLP